ncbi:hypothetical protein LCGC14_1029310 [marine sediment metagenome]|uniref:SWIM-type domain-containing protein n=1 Tax=marine sediment metagenome TaxID=412755 RepID=A0A0F9MZM3_9ZZZZ
MVLEELLYLQNSKFLESAIILQPELTKSKMLFEADLVDSNLVIECFFLLFEVVKIKRGRDPLYTERRSYDPIITVRDNDIQFETFSHDMTNYACMVFNDSAFTNVNYWEKGVTNVDFTPEFINTLRKAGGSKVKSISVDPEGFSVDISDKESLHEKKVELPENWEIALDNLRKYVKSRRTRTSFSGRQGNQFDLFAQPKLARLELTWRPKDELLFSRYKFRKNLGYAILGSTLDITKRMDGRTNPRYMAIRSEQMLKTIKTYILYSESTGENEWVVYTNKAKFKITKDSDNIFRCNCPDYIFRGKAKGNHIYQCKHIMTVLKPKLDIVLEGENKWSVHTLGENKVLEKNIVLFRRLNFKCTCIEHKRYNLCPHIVEVMRNTEDFQFKELLEDLSYNVHVVSKEDGSSLNLLKPTRKIKVTEENLKYLNNSRVVIYKSKVEFIERKTSKYGDKYTEFFIITLKDVSLGPKLEEANKQMSLTNFFTPKNKYIAYRRQTIPNLVIRLSAKTFHGLNLKVGSSIRMLGTLKENKRYGYLLMRIAEAKSG